MLDCGSKCVEKRKQTYRRRHRETSPLTKYSQSSPEKPIKSKMAEQELSLINKVELRIALADSDSKFQGALDLYLCPLLLKLGSTHSSSRSAVLNFIKDLISRLNGAPAVQLPVLKLIEQSKKPSLPAGSSVASTQLYSLLLAAKGLDRLEDKQSLIKPLLEGIEAFEGPVCSRLFNLFIRSLAGWKTPDRGTDEFKALQSSLNLPASTVRFITSKLEQLFLLVPSYNDKGIIPKGTTCPGLSADEVSFLTYDCGYFPKPAELSSVKKDVTSFISLLQDRDIFLLLLIGAEDSNDHVANSSAALLRKITIPFEDEVSIEHMISLYVGDKSIPRPPVKPKLQERFLTVLNGSVIATKHRAVPIISSIGLNATRYPRLKSATISFIQWAAKNGDQGVNGSSEYLVNVAAQLKNNLQAEGWPRFEVQQGASFSAELKQRRIQYEALGDLLKKDPSLIEDMTYITFLFDSLIGDIADVRSTIQDALGGLVVHLKGLPVGSKARLKYLMKLYLESGVCFIDHPDSTESVRYTALKFINSAFPFEDAEARMLNVLGSSSINGSSVIEEAQKGLHPYWFNITHSSATTEFKSTDELLGVGNVLTMPSFDSFVINFTEAITQAKNDPDSTLKGSMVHGAKFALYMLVEEAIAGKPTVVVKDQEWITRLENALNSDFVVMNLVKYNIKSSNPLTSFLQILADNITRVDSGLLLADKGEEVFAKIFLEIISLSPNEVIQTILPVVPNLVSVIQNSKVVNYNLIMSCANAIGIIGSHPQVTNQDVTALFETLLEGLKSELKQKRDYLLALSFLTSRVVYRRRHTISTSQLKQVWECVLEAFENSFGDSGIIGLTQLAMYGALGPNVQLDNMDEVRNTIVEELKKKVNKLDERSIIATACVSLSLEESEYTELTDLETTIYETSSTKQVESLFTSGEALSIMAAGWNSRFLQQKLDIQDSSLAPLTSKRSFRLNVILDKVLETCTSTKPSLRRAGCIWLLSLVQYCGHLPQIKEMSGVIHISFMRYLADKDEFIQDSASRGLSMIYELGDSDLKETLVKNLLKSFTDSTSASKLSAGSVSTDTELFEPGILKTNDGSVSTYKDILNLASEVGDPSLVYKFMSMAKSSALWSSRKGIAFGLGSIMSKASIDQMIFENPSLSNRLIPKLYRYRFDPSMSVSKAMNDIWATLVPNTSKTVERYQDVILNELLNSMGNKEWRVREASTVALTDLIQTLPVERYQERMEDIWTMAFRGLDDIKETVRKAASGLTRALSKILVNGISVESGSSQTQANIMLEKLLPFLLGHKGILSDAEDVREFSLSTILTLVKKSGKSIKPYIGQLIQEFILLMSTLEPQIINYLTLNADKYNLKSDEIDAKRLQGLGSSPIMNAIERLVDQVDENNIDIVVSKVQESVKKSVGLPSKAAASRVIVMLIMRQLYLIKPYGETLLNTCGSQLKDRNTTVSSSYATAAGYCCRVCSVDVVVKYSKKIQSMFFESEEEKPKIVAGIATEAVSKYSGDMFVSVASAFLPLAFFGKQYSSKDISKLFERVWTENTSGKGAIRLYFSEICDLVKEHINGQQFAMRQVSAKSIAIACDSLNSTAVASVHVDELFTILLKSCQGRSWAGKEDVLSALVSLTLKSKFYISEHPDVFQDIQKTVIVESKRRNKAYQKHALVSFADFAQEFPSVILFENALNIFEGIFSEDYYDSEDEDEDGTTNEKVIATSEISSRKNLTREADRMRALTSMVKIFQLYPDGSYNDEYLIFALNSLTATFDPKVYIPTWRSQLAVVEGISKISIVLKGHSLSDDVHNHLIESWNLIYHHNTKTETVENVKVQTVRTAGELVEIGDENLAHTVVKSLQTFKGREANSIVLVEITKVLQNHLE